MSKQQPVKRTVKFMGANARVVLGAAFIFSLVFGLAFWRSEIVSALQVPGEPEQLRAQQQDDTVQSPEGTVRSFSNNAVISIPATGTGPGNASPYPSTINVSSGAPGTISKVTVTLNLLTHTFARDLDIILVGPGGQRSILMSDAGNGKSCR